MSHGNDAAAVLALRSLEILMKSDVEDSHSLDLYDKITLSLSGGHQFPCSVEEFVSRSANGLMPRILNDLKRMVSQGDAAMGVLSVLLPLLASPKFCDALHGDMVRAALETVVAILSAEVRICFESEVLSPIYNTCLCHVDHRLRPK